MEFKAFSRIEEIPLCGCFLAVVKHSFQVNHCVTVLEILKKRAVVGDPLQGRIVLNREEFADRWRFTGIELKKRCSVGSAAGKAQCVVHDG